MKSWTAILYVWLILAGFTTFADEHDIEVPPQQETDTTRETTPPPAQTNQATKESFTPTETISEDLSVPFPVDI